MASTADNARPPRTRWMRPLPGILLGMILCWGISAPILAAPTQSRADTLKCAFLINFLDFIDWQPEPAGPIAIVLVGTNPKLDELHAILRQHPSLGKRFDISRAVSFADVQGAQLVYTQGSPSPAELEAMKALVAGGTVAIADAPGFVEAGGTIEFVFHLNRWRFRINVPQAQGNEHFRISSKLLRLRIP